MPDPLYILSPIIRARNRLAPASNQDSSGRPPLAGNSQLNPLAPSFTPGASSHPPQEPSAHPSYQNQSTHPTPPNPSGTQPPRARPTPTTPFRFNPCAPPFDPTNPGIFHGASSHHQHLQYPHQQQQGREHPLAAQLRAHEAAAINATLMSTAADLAMAQNARTPEAAEAAMALNQIRGRMTAAANQARRTLPPRERQMAMSRGREIRRRSMSPRDRVERWTAANLAMAEHARTPDQAEALSRMGGGPITAAAGRQARGTFPAAGQGQMVASSRGREIRRSMMSPRDRVERWVESLDAPTSSSGTMSGVTSAVASGAASGATSGVASDVASGVTSPGTGAEEDHEGCCEEWMGTGRCQCDECCERGECCKECCLCSEKKAEEEAGEEGKRREGLTNSGRGGAEGE